MSKLNIADIRGAIFDVDGTLLDSMGVWYSVGADYLGELGVEVDKDLGATLFSMTMTQAAEYLMDTYDLMKVTAFRERLTAAEGDNPSIEKIADFLAGEMEGTMHRFYMEKAEARPGASELLKRMREAGIPMTIASSTAGYLIRVALERLDLMKYFTGLISGQDLKISKENEDPFILCLQAMGIDPEDREAVGSTWVFEDGLYAIETARDMGLKTVGVYDSVSKDDREEIERISDIYVKEISELL